LTVGLVIDHLLKGDPLDGGKP